ncbi:MAG: DUF3536 domain-containing protein [Nitrospirota bacterium]|nr:DUF3536 domain-containing protein [Nitrospirota bacterium]
MEKYICIHGHFYQPPRENAWLEEVELQDSAHPYHDWNERITAECYAPNTASRILDPEGNIIDIVSNYSRMSFNFGPSLLSWMERHSPGTYQAILEADRLSMANFSGHGSAIAQAYSHMIMPLANSRTKYTQVIWGIRDFEHRFKRRPEGMWLPETAVDLETLEVLADLGISFTILAPRQAEKTKKIERRSRWVNVSGGKIDPRNAYLCRLPSGKKINLFFYDGPIAQDIAFGGLLSNGEEFAKRLFGAFSEDRKQPQLIHIATDGETYGHHHQGGDMALAYCLHKIELKKDVKLTNYAEFLEKHPPVHEVRIFENSSWSCVHGIERWKDNCGCCSGGNPQWNQEWRKPLREALDELRFSVISIFEKGVKELLTDPWKARDDYISVILDRSAENIDGFFSRHSARRLTEKERTRALKFLEMQRNAMLMYTSCGWFFDEISGIETVQIMQYASKVIQLVQELENISLEQDFLDIIESAPSNVYENGAKPYELFVRPMMLDLLRVGAHYVISSLFHEYPEQTKLFCYTVTSGEHKTLKAEKQRLATGKADIVSDITGERTAIFFAILQTGYHDITAGVSYFTTDGQFSAMQKETEDAFERGDMPSAAKLIHKHFGGNIFSLSHLFRDEQRKIITQILQLAYEDIDTSFRHIYDNYYDIMDFFRSLNIQIPKSFATAIEHVMNRELKNIFDAEEIMPDRLEKLIKEVKKWSVELDRATAGFIVSSRISSLMEELAGRPEDTPYINKLESILRLSRELPLELNLWKAQNIYFSIAKKLCVPLSEKADAARQKWAQAFSRLGQHLQVKIT